ncbi:MAG TPA: glutamate--tRNA ligase family protein [Fibrobacteria bacterium]|nr:glutamate--tRNA ligase family protein [Fibrobacteria bacterium]
MKTRIAPTPSGLVHAGNAWSFLLTWLLARSRGGSIHLRIDDLDAARLREEYVGDVFASLVWLGLDWDSGPRSVPEALGPFSQRARLDRYRAALQVLAAQETADGPLVYPCACSREKVKRDALAAGRPGIYPGTCRRAGLAFDRSSAVPGREAGADSFPLRIRVPEDAAFSVAGAEPGAVATLSPGKDMGDFVIWQRDGEPAYQLASLVDDEEYGIDLVVRGRDLLPSTGAQAYLASRLGYPGFARARFLHHALLVDAPGGKLSKSEGADSLRALRERLPGPGPLLRRFADFLGLGPGEVSRADDLLADFSPSRIPEHAIPWTGLSF